MRIEQIVYFQKVCEYNNMTKAANELNVTQPTISIAIQDLESEFGVKLFDRENKKLIITEEGKYFLNECQNILERLHNVYEYMSFQSGKQTNIHIGVPPTIGSFLIPTFFKDFSLKQPNIHFELQEYCSLNIANLVDNGTVDMALVIGQDNIDERFNYHTIMSSRLLFYVNKTNKLASKQSLDLLKLSPEPMIFLRHGAYQNHIINEYYEKNDLEPNVFMYSNQLYSIQKYISENQAGAFLLEDIELLFDNIVGIPLTQDITLKISVIWKKNKAITKDYKDFIEFAKEYEYKHN